MKCRDCKKELENDAESFELETSFSDDEEFYEKFYLCNECFMKSITGQKK